MPCARPTVTLGGIFVAGARDLRLLVGTGDRVPSGAMILRFFERVSIDDEDGIAFGTYLGEDGITREAVLRTGPEGLAEIAVEGAPAPGGGRYAGFQDAQPYQHHEIVEIVGHPPEQAPQPTTRH
jgi:hypothetical protein